MPLLFIIRKEELAGFPNACTIAATAEDKVVFGIEVGAGGGEIAASQQVCLLVKDDYPHGGLLVFFLIHIAIFLLFNHDLELCSSSFTFGRTRASSILLSLNHDLFTIFYIYAVLRGLLREFPTIESEPSTVRIRVIREIRGRYSCALVAEVQLEGAGIGLLASGEAGEHKDGAAGVDGHVCGWIVELVAGSEVEHGLVVGIKADGRERAGEGHIVGDYCLIDVLDDDVAE